MTPNSKSLKNRNKDSLDALAEKHVFAHVFVQTVCELKTIVVTSRQNADLAKRETPRVHVVRSQPLLVQSVRPPHGLLAQTCHQ